MDAEAETVLLEDGFGDGEAEAGPLLARVGAGAVVAVEDIGQVLGGDCLLYTSPKLVGLRWAR